MRMRRKTMELLTVIALLLALVIFNVAIVLLDTGENKEGSPLRVNGQIKGSRIEISRIMQEAVK